jgi:hypothetical protein
MIIDRDLMTRLRKYRMNADSPDVVTEAADEIERLRAELATNRERLAGLIEADICIRHSQFAWLVYPDYMAGVKTGMEHAAALVRQQATKGEPVVPSPHPPNGPFKP